VHPDDTEDAAYDWLRVLAGETLPPRGRRVVRPDGTVRWIEVTTTNLLGTPAVGAIVGSVRDITDQERVDEALNLAQQRFTALFDSGTIGIIVSDESGAIQATPPEWAGWTAEAMEERLRVTHELPKMSPGVITVPQASTTDTLGVICVSQAMATDTLGVICVPQAMATDTIRVTCVPQEAGSVPQVRGRASQISTCVPLASSCVSQGMPTVSFGATKEGSPCDVRASRSNECVARLADCAARPKDCVSRRSHSASTSDLRCAPRSDCVSRLDVRASPHSHSPLWSLRSARSPRLACLSFEQACRSALRPTRNSKLAPLWAVPATSKPLLATSNSLRATPSSCRAATNERPAARSSIQATSNKSPEQRGVPRKARRALVPTTSPEACVI
jgi:hypothetical protein